jgi:hypothetical protein
LAVIVGWMDGRSNGLCLWQYEAYVPIKDDYRSLLCICACLLQAEYLLLANLFYSFFMQLYNSLNFYWILFIYFQHFHLIVCLLI